MALDGWAPGRTIDADPAVDTVVLDEATLEVVLYDERVRQLRYLNHSAAATWLLCDGAADAASIAAELAEIFGLDAMVADETVAAALDAFWEAGLLAGSPPPAGAMGDQEGVRVLPREPDP